MRLLLRVLSYGTYNLGYSQSVRDRVRKIGRVLHENRWYAMAVNPFLCCPDSTRGYIRRWVLASVDSDGRLIEHAQPLEDRGALIRHALQNFGNCDRALFRRWRADDVEQSRSGHDILHLSVIT